MIVRAASGKKACFRFPGRSLSSAKIMQASGKESLLSVSRAQLIFCKDSKFSFVCQYIAHKNCVLASLAAKGAVELRFSINNATVGYTEARQWLLAYLRYVASLLSTDKRYQVEIH